MREWYIRIRYKTVLLKIKDTTKMARAQSKTDLLKDSESNFSILMEIIKNMNEKELNAEFNLDVSVNKKEAHWQRDKNIRDVLIQLYEWQELLLHWIHSNMTGEEKPFLPEPYNWKTYGEMNISFWKKHQQTSCNDAIKLLEQSHKKVMTEIEKFSNEELFQKGKFKWTGTTTLGSYCVSSASSHYDWAIKKIKFFRKAKTH
ncbi:hypothetical protein HMPREF9554_01688 [Treponema phagedenis F0421]|nr:hypothetical protein HMPREF9554_01688 [Treponema phagedenis F0421]